jgi:hypothetical protein
MNVSVKITPAINITIIWMYEDNDCEMPVRQASA